MAYVIPPIKSLALLQRQLNAALAGLVMLTGDQSIAGIKTFTSGIIHLGGDTSSYPELKRNGATIDVRIADDSGYSNIQLNALTAFGVVKTAPYTVATLPSAVANGAGSRSFASDVTAATYNTTAVGGGANKMGVISDGAIWKNG